MTDKVILGAFDNTYVLRVALPGYDVKDPNLPTKCLAFDSRWNAMATVVMSGTVRGRARTQDMTGMQWYGQFTVPSDYVGLPVVVLSPWPEFSSDYRVGANIGLYLGFFGYDPATRICSFEGEAVWYPDNINSTERDFGYFRYHLLRVD